MRIFIVVTVLALCSICVAADSISSADHILKPLVGKCVQVEGLAWGAFAKGLGERVVLPSGDRLYLSGEEYLKQHLNGKLIRLVGQLSIKTMEPVSKGGQGYTTRFRYYSIEVESFELIEKIQHGFPKKLKENLDKQKKARRKK